MDDPWYGDILTYLQSLKFPSHLTHDDRLHIRHQAPCYILIGDDIYLHYVDIVICHCLTHARVDQVLNS